MIERALPGQILLGNFRIETTDEKTRRILRYDTLDLIETTAASLDQLQGMNVSGGSIDNIRCYLTGQSLGGGRYTVHRYHIVDKHGTTRTLYNAKINIHRANAEPIFLGIQTPDLQAFSNVRMESLRRDGEETGSFYVRP
jgi:hypothetical protein